MNKSCFLIFFVFAHPGGLRRGRKGGLPQSATGVGTIQLGHAGQMAVALEGGRLLLPATCDHVALYSQTGALVAKGQNTRQLGVSGLPAGLYLLRATVQGQVLTQKVVIR